MTLSDLNYIAEEKKALFNKSYIIDYNKVFVTIFNDGTSILRPPILGGSDGFVFYNLDEMNKIIISQQYPIIENNNFWQKEKTRIERINENIEYYFQKLSKELNYNVKIDTDSIYLKNLSKTINNRFKKIKDKNTFNYYLAIYITEILRIKSGSNWKLKLQYSFNNYYLPEITRGNSYCSPWNNIFGRLKMLSFVELDVEQLILDINEFYEYTGNRYVNE